MTWLSRRSFVAALTAGLSGCLTYENQVEGLTTSEQTATQTTTAGLMTTRTTTSTTSTTTEAPSGPRIDVDLNRDDFDLNTVSFEERPQFILDRRENPICIYDVGDVDSIENIKRATIKGETGQMPIRIFRTMMRLTYCFRESGRDPFLEKAATIGDAALEEAEIVDGVPYFPYTMQKVGSSVTMEPPWYSGMAQGTALSAFVRLYEHTGTERHRRIVEGVADSFRRLPRSTEGPWTSMVEDGYYWIEEYPADPPTHVLNGFLVGLWGLYEYWLVFESEWAKRLLDAAMTTMRAHLDEYREPGDVSWYGLDQPEGYRGNETYHAVHIHQIGVLYRLTGDPFFRKMERRFESDSPESAGIPSDD